MGMVPFPPDLLALDAGTPGQDNPVSVTAAFMVALMTGTSPNLRVLRRIVTPDSWAAWGDFTTARRLVTDCGLATRHDEATFGPDAEPFHVAYTKLLPEPGSESAFADTPQLIDAYICSLISDDDRESWQVHTLGSTLWEPSACPR